MSETANPPALAVVDLREFARRVGISRATACRLLAAGEAPPRIRLSARRFGFVSADIDRWVAERRETRCV